MKDHFPKVGKCNQSTKYIEILKSKIGKICSFFKHVSLFPLNEELEI